MTRVRRDITEEVLLASSMILFDESIVAVKRRICQEKVLTAEGLKAWQVVDLIKNPLVWCLAFFLKLIQGRRNPWRHD